MSKNFELLQKIGGDEKLFRPVTATVDDFAENHKEEKSPLDGDFRDRFLQNASLPDVFQTASEPASRVPAAISELQPGRVEESKQGVSENNPIAQTMQAFRSASKAIASPAASPRLHNSAAAQPTSPGSLPKLPRRPNRAISAPPAQPSPEPVSGSGKESQAKLLRRNLPKFDWMGVLKAEAKSWKWKTQSRNSHHEKNLEAIARAEEMKLVQRVFPETREDAPRVAIFADLETEAGCARICAHTGEMLAARAEGPVCIVDANFGSPRLHNYFDVENLKGLAEAVFESGPVENFAQQVPGSDLWLMPSGGAGAQLNFAAMANGLRSRITELRAAFRYVVIHAGSFRLEANAMLLSRWADGIVLVVEANSTRREAAKRAKEDLVAANVNLLGVVLNNRTFPIPEAIYRKL
jgi:hypothetical protein